MHKPELFQVDVEFQGKRLRVGPKMAKQMADEFAAAIRGQIAIGREKHWCDPQVVPARARGVLIH